MSDSARPNRVIQWCTEKIGQISIRHFAANPALELVGGLTTSADKDGVDAGELAVGRPRGLVHEGTTWRPAP